MRGDSVQLCPPTRPGRPAGIGENLQPCIGEDLQPLIQAASGPRRRLLLEGALQRRDRRGARTCRDDAAIQQVRNRAEAFIT